MDTAGRDSAPLQTEGSAPEIPAGSVDVDTAAVEWVGTADPPDMSLLDADRGLSDTAPVPALDDEFGTGIIDPGDSVSFGVERFDPNNDKGPQF
jgi:hypothetical protein